MFPEEYSERQYKLNSELWSACSEGYVTPVALLLSAGAIPDSFCLKRVIKSGSIELVKFLLDKTNLTLTVNNSCVDVSIEMFKFLLERRNEWKYGRTDNDWLLEILAQRGSLENLLYFLSTVPSYEWSNETIVNHARGPYRYNWEVLDHFTPPNELGLSPSQQENLNHLTACFFHYRPKTKKEFLFLITKNGRFGCYDDLPETIKRRLINLICLNPRRKNESTNKLRSLQTNSLHRSKRRSHLLSPKRGVKSGLYRRRRSDTLSQGSLHKRKQTGRDGGILSTVKRGVFA